MNARVIYGMGMIYYTRTIACHRDFKAAAEGNVEQISNYYLLSKWGPLRRIVRYSFYVNFFLFNWAGCFQVPLS